MPPQTVSMLLWLPAPGLTEDKPDGLRMAGSAQDDLLDSTGNRPVFQLGIFLRALRPARTVLRPARLYSALTDFFFLNNNFFLQNVAVFVFSDSRCKNACKMLSDLCPCFHRSPTKLCTDLVSFARWIVTKFWSFTRKSEHGHSRSKLCSIMCRLRTKLCPNFGCLCARMCPISFAPCPFPNLAGTLKTVQLNTRNQSANMHSAPSMAPTGCGVKTIHRSRQIVIFSTEIIPIIPMLTN